MLILNFSPFPLLLTERLVLRKVEPGDVEEIFFLRSDKRVMEYLVREPAQSFEEALAFIQKLHDLEKKNEAVTWAIATHDNPRLIGTICFWNIQREHDRAEIGYVLHPDFQGKGIMQEAMNKVLGYGFDTMKLHSVEANVTPENTPSVRLLERNKFNREAYFRENYYFKGRYLDTAVYVRLTPAQ